MPTRPTKDTTATGAGFIPKAPKPQPGLDPQMDEPMAPLRAGAPPAPGLPRPSREDRRLEALLRPERKPSNQGLLRRYASYPAQSFIPLSGGFGFGLQSQNMQDIEDEEGNVTQSAWGTPRYIKGGPDPRFYTNPFFRPWFDITAEGPGGFAPRDPFKSDE